MRNNQGQFIRNRVKKECAVCGNEFEVIYRRRNSAKFCSHKCQGMAFSREVIMNCLECGKQFIRRPCDNKRSGYSNKYCGLTCYHNYQKRTASYSRGLLADLWAWKKWALTVYQKNNYICRICGIRGGKLNAHHVKMVSQYPDNAFDVNNGITLCVDCHIKLHQVTGTMGRKDGELNERLLKANVEPSPINIGKVQRLSRKGVRSQIKTVEAPSNFKPELMK